jgi:hypothetical protein
MRRDNCTSNVEKEKPMKHVSKIGILMFAVAVAAAAIAAGCASTPLHTEAATSGIRAADEVGAAGVPQAALHLQLAKEELARARGLAAEDEHEQASSMLSRAEADAELAVALSRESAERSEAQAAMEQVRQLRQDYR